MAQPQAGNTVSIHYTGRLEDGTVFDSSEDGDPLAFTVGAGQVIPGFEQAVLGLAPGESTTTTIAPEDGYGDHREDLIIALERDQMPAGNVPQAGQMIALHLQDGGQIQAMVTDVSDEAVTIDANHPLAGQTLIFDIKLVSID